jgi:hypothetical protein
MTAERLRNSTRRQAEVMASFSGVELTSEQFSLYCELRNSFESKYNRLTDQRLLARILLMTSANSSFERFVCTYENIFFRK